MLFRSEGGETAQFGGIAGMTAYFDSFIERSNLRSKLIGHGTSPSGTWRPLQCVAMDAKLASVNANGFGHSQHHSTEWQIPKEENGMREQKMVTSVFLSLKYVFIKMYFCS